MAKSNVYYHKVCDTEVHEGLYAPSYMLCHKCGYEVRRNEVYAVYADGSTDKRPKTGKRPNARHKFK